MQTITARQIWNLPTYTAPNTAAYCTPVTLPAGGILSFAVDNVVTITKAIVFEPRCTDAADSSDQDLPTVSPFYASATPQVFVVAAATVLAWVLVTMLVISPRTFMNNLGAGPSPYSVGMGIIGGANGGTTSSVGIGSRPWLQKAAALTVAISLTIATADTFRVSQAHYPAGIDGNSMRTLVENSLEIRITRLISDIFVWLAQVQTLIRLFPRHKEKVLIKWIGFALIVLDTTFSCLNSFLVNDYRRPRDFVDAIPALSYLFELALSLLYAAWVIYYAFTKRQYAFFHAKMRTVTLIAVLALVAILTPVVFFITDITFPDVAGWGDYFRWVGAAAASVIVWEWVERIEILERDEKKDGILGREIFDGDEMLDMMPNGEMTYNGGRKDDYFTDSKGGSGSGGGTSIKGSPRKITFNLPRKFSRNRANKVEDGLGQVTRQTSTSTRSSNLNKPLPPTRAHPRASNSITPPPPSVSPPSRTDTTSAASTVYVVQHDGQGDIQPVRRRIHTPEVFTSTPIPARVPEEPAAEDKDDVRPKTFTSGWQNVPNPFKRKRTTPPLEVRAVMRASKPPNAAETGSPPSRSNFDFRSRLNGTVSRLGQKPDKKPSDGQTQTELPWTIIPAQPRGTTWSPSPVNNDTLSTNVESPLQSPGQLSDQASTLVDSGNSPTAGTFGSSSNNAMGPVRFVPRSIYDPGPSGGRHS